MQTEFGSTGKASRRSDVYSYGIVLLEVFTRKKPTDPMFVSELTFRQWINQAFPYELSNVTDCSLQQDGHTGTEDLSKLSEDSIIVNTCLASIIELGLLCSRDAPDDRVPMNEVVIRLNKIKSNYYSLCGSNGAHLVKYPEIPSLVHLETNQNGSEEKNL